jgi:hypothetical protein
MEFCRQIQAGFCELSIKLIKMKWPLTAANDTGTLKTGFDPDSLNAVMCDLLVQDDTFTDNQNTTPDTN